MRHPALPLRHRHGYAVDLHRGLPALKSMPNQKFPAQPARRVCTANQPTSTGLELALPEEALQHRFLAYTFPSHSPGPTHPAVLGRPNFVEAALTTPSDPQGRLPPASPRRYDGKATKVSHLHPNQQRLVAHCS
jgi:hypothetical protein